MTAIRRPARRVERERRLTDTDRAALLEELRAEHFQLTPGDLRKETRS